LNYQARSFKTLDEESTVAFQRLSLEDRKIMLHVVAALMIYTAVLSGLAVMAFMAMAVFTPFKVFGIAGASSMILTLLAFWLLLRYKPSWILRRMAKDKSLFQESKAEPFFSVSRYCISSYFCQKCQTQHFRDQELWGKHHTYERGTS